MSTDYYLSFSNLLVIHQVETKKTQPRRKLGYPVLIKITVDF